MDRLACGFEVKFAEGAPEGTFSGYGAMFGSQVEDEDGGGDVILKGPSARRCAMPSGAAIGRR